MAWLTKSVSDLGPKSENIVYNYSRYLAKFHDQTYIQTCFPSCVLILIMTLKLLKLIAQTVKFFIKDFFSKCTQIRSFLRIWSHLLKKSLMGNFIFCAVNSSPDSNHFIICSKFSNSFHAAIVSSIFVIFTLSLLMSAKTFQERHFQD